MLNQINDLNLLDIGITIWSIPREYPQKLPTIDRVKILKMGSSTDTCNYPLKEAGMCTLVLTPPHTHTIYLCIFTLITIYTCRIIHFIK